MEEIWKDIKGYEGLYQISNFGNVKSLPKFRVKYHTGEIILKQQNSANGYKQINLYKNNKHRTEKIHRLVAEAFIPNPENKPEVNHIDGDKTNNYIGNLEWNTRKENGKHAWNIGLFKHYSPPPPKQKKKVNQYSLDGKFIRTWNGLVDASRELNISHDGICNCCVGRQKQCGGYIWKHAN